MSSLPSDFDSVYRDNADPWEQSGRGHRQPYYAAARVALAQALGAHLRDVMPAPEEFTGLEIGCGLGYAMEHVRRVVGGVWTGMDVSPTAVHRAAERWPHRFVVGDIRKGSENIPPNERFDVVMWSQILWYVCEPAADFCEAVRNSLKLVRPGGLFVVHQAFIPMADQKFCKPDFHGFDATLEQFLKWPNTCLLEARFDPVERVGLFDGRIVMQKVI